MSKKTEYTYDLSEVLDFEVLSSVRPGTSILVTGPSMTGKDNLVFDMLAAGAEQGEAGILMTTDEDGAATLDTVAETASGVDRALLAAIDCRADSGRDERELGDGGYVYSVTEPSELTGIGIGVTNCFERMSEHDVEHGRMALTSLSTMVRYADRKTVFKFCHVLSQRLESAGFVGLFTLNSGAHDDQTVQVIKQAFDANIEVRNGADGREARVLGLGSGPTEWQSL
jgi:KaiC/GvpD/RAD55 family RecA-like ATPase